MNEGEILLVKNKVTLKSSSDDLASDELAPIIKQKPNRKILGLFYFYLGIHNLGNKPTAEKREKKVNQWLLGIGEAPVILDTFLCNRTEAQMELFLKKHGYFEGMVDHEILYYPKRKENKKKAKVYYKVDAGESYKIRKLEFNNPDTAMSDDFRSGVLETIIKRGKRYDEDVFADERKRLSNHFKNKGYYNFSPDHIIFEIDSTIPKRNVDVRMIVKAPFRREKQNDKDVFVEGKHEKFTIENVYVVTDYEKNLLPETRDRIDTIVTENGLHIIYFEELKFKADLLRKSIFIKKGDIYNLNRVNYTYGRLADLKTFKFINIQFEEITTLDGSRKLNCFINLTASKKQSMGIETDFTNRAGNLGLMGNLVFRNKNSLRGAEIFELKLKGGLEAAQQGGTNATGALENSIFNTLEYGIESSFHIPELWVPKFFKTTPNYEKPKTNFNLAYNYQNRPDFERQIFNFSYVYSWNKSRFHNFSVFPVDVSLIQIDKTDAFTALLEQLNNPFLTNSYSDQFIPAGKFTYSFSNQRSELINYSFFRFDFESAGNLLSVLSPTINLPQNEEGNYLVGGIRYAQYLKVINDIRQYNVLNRWSRIVYRGLIGVGVPYNNLNVLPFEKSFFGGGANDMRGWIARSLGPGSLMDTIPSVDQIGDISLIFNVEYRFKMFGLLEGALFADAGNVWLLNEDKQRPNGHFELDRFFKEISISAGYGLRLDFSFFVLRFDLAAKVYDPKHLEGERWIFDQQKVNTNALIDDYRERTNRRVPDPTPPFISLLNLNFGIGYPF